ncbi:F-box only protein 15 isoform X6 [Rissa tridactyla]|uniref:F-box only protein 15 isoform X6 n=1 Tax=Rissa tridactyla TaxID=75485 RepID=UPI0023BB15BF|nr:F-box only protein 15 isoform X6 [Rissa tridactyla]
MATGRGRALRLYGNRQAPAAEVAAPSAAAEVGPFTPAAAAVAAPRAGGPRNRSRSFAARPGECSEAVNARIKSLCLTPSMKPKPRLCIESMPSEMLMKIFSYLDAVSLLCVGCVNKHFYHLANDNGIWLRIYSSCFRPKRTIWKMMSEQTETVSLDCAALHDRKPGYWKKEYIFKQIAAVKTRVMRLVKPVDPYTGLPCKNKEAIKASGLSWIIVLKDKNGKEHIMEKANLSFKDTSVTILWYSTNWPCLDILSALKLFGVTPLLPDQSRDPSKNGPRRRSLIAEYHLVNLTESSVALGADKLVQLFGLNPGLLVGLWKEKNEIAFVMVSLHYHQLLERSTLGSATVQYALPPNKPVLDDVDPEYGLHDYSLHLDIHGGSFTYLCGTFKSLFCRKGDIANGYLRLTVVSLKDNTKHLPLIGTLGLSWETEAFKGNVKDCCVMDVTLLDEAGKPFWCFSAPVYMELSSKASSFYDYMGHIYTTDYADSEGKVCVELVWLEETKEYFIVNLVLYISTRKSRSKFRSYHLYDQTWKVTCGFTQTSISSAPIFLSLYRNMQRGVHVYLVKTFNKILKREAEDVFSLNINMGMYLAELGGRMSVFTLLELLTG